MINRQLEASVKHLRYFVWCRLLTCPKTWLKASSLVLFFWSDFSTLSDYSHLWKRHLKEWTGVKKYKQRGNKKKGSLWQKTRTEKTDSLYKWGGGGTHERRRREGISAICSRFFLLSSTSVYEGRACTLTLTHTHTMNCGLLLPGC